MKTAYQEFIEDPKIDKGKISRLWELEVDGPIDNVIDFARNFLEKEGFKYTGYTKDTYTAIFNGNYVFAGAIQDGNKVAIRINQI